MALWDIKGKRANIGISLPGTGEAPSCPVYVDGVQTITLQGDNLRSDFFKIIDEYTYLSDKGTPMIVHVLERI